MQALDEIVHLAVQLQQLETQGAEVTGSWYDFGPAEQNEPGELNGPAEVAHITQSAATILGQMSTKLNTVLQTTQQSDSVRHRLQYAYNTVQELLQSRNATEDMTSAMAKNPGTAYQEYLRAVAIKEQAALSQVNKLLDTLVEIQSDKTQFH